MESNASPELSEDVVEATANAFVTAFMSLPLRVRNRFIEIIEKRNGLENKTEAVCLDTKAKRLETKAERKEMYRERNRERKKERDQVIQRKNITKSTQEPDKQLNELTHKAAQKQKKAVNTKKSKTQQHISRSSSITAAEAAYIKFRNLNPQTSKSEQSQEKLINEEPTKPYRVASKLISSGARFCELCGKYHQGNTCY